MVPLALLALAQPELNCQDAAPPHNPHLHYRQRTKGWVGGVAVVLVVLGCGGCAYYQNAKKKKAVEVGLDADSLKFEGVGP